MCVVGGIWVECVFRRVDVVSVVHTVAILSAVFCVICSLLKFVSDSSGDHMVASAPISGGRVVLTQFVQMSVLFQLRAGCVFLELCGRERRPACVKRVHVVLSGLRMRLFARVHVCISCRYAWMFVLAMFMSLCVDVMVMCAIFLQQVHVVSPVLNFHFFLCALLQVYIYIICESKSTLYIDVPTLLTWTPPF